MTTLGNLVKPARPLDLPSLVASLPSPVAPPVGWGSITAAMEAWINQDEDAHEPCSLTACRSPLHPGPCKGWKHTLHSVSPGAWHQLEEARVKKANERRVKRITDLHSQGKPIPRRLLTEIKAKPAPSHPANNVQAVPLAQVNQKADLAGGTAHSAGQAVSKAAGVHVSQAPPLPLGPKAQKPTVAGRGPAFVITQPKVTDQYKLDKAAKLTPQEWDALSPADKLAIRGELAKISIRGFGPQQTKANALLAKLPAAPTPVHNPGAVHQAFFGKNAPGKVTLGQAVHAPAPPTRPTTHVPSSTASGPGSFTQAHTALNITSAIHGPQTTDPQRVANILEKAKQAGPLDQSPVFRQLVDRLAQDALTQASTDNMPGLGHGANDVGITEFNHQIRDHILGGKPGLPPLVQQMSDHHAKVNAPAAPHIPAPPPAVPRAVPDPADNVRKALDPSRGLSLAARTYVYRKLTKAQFDSLDDATKGKVLDDLDKQIATGSGPGRLAQDLKDSFTPGTTKTAPVPPAAAPSVPKALSPDAQQARAVAGRAVPKAQMSKTQVDAYGKLSKADFDQLDAKTQKTIRDDLANSKAKFLDPKKQQVAADLLDRFGSRHPAPAATAPAPPSSGGKIYTAVHNGKTYTRSGSQPYTHASVVRRSDGTEEVASFHTSENAALKGTLTAQQKQNGSQVIKAVRVTSDGSTPAVAKGYSDPMSEVIKAAQGGDNAKFFQAVGRLSPETVTKLDDGDRKQILNQLAFIATHPKASQDQKDKAAAYGRIINGGTHVPSTVKFDHTPSIGELHAEEQKGGHAAVADALKAAVTPNMPRADRLKDLSALSKPQFDALKPEEQRKITDALHVLHTDQQLNGSTVRDADAEKALTAYTGVHPGIHSLRQAETDFRAGKVDGESVWRTILHARVASPGSSHTPGSPGDALAKEEQRVAEDNPKLPIWLRATMIDNPYGKPQYDVIQRAQNKYNYEAAPRFSNQDITSIFRPSAADLAASHPIHAEAVQALRANLISTGLRGEPGVPTGSPWSISTRNHVVDNILHISHSNPEIPADRLKEYQALPSGQQDLIRKVLRDRINGTNDGFAKTATWLALRDLEGKDKLAPEVHAAVLAASDKYNRGMEEAYRKLDPRDFDKLPSYTQGAIISHLTDLQLRTASGGPTRTWSAGDNPLKVMPSALAAHLMGSRPDVTDRRVRNATDVANYGRGIINPYDRAVTYGHVPIGVFRTMPVADQRTITDDLDKIAHDTSGSVPVRYRALFTKDFMLGDPSHLTGDQFAAVHDVDPMPANAVSDSDVAYSLNNLGKADFDKLDKTYQDAIDARIGHLSGPQQQLFTAKFHPAAPMVSPSGYTPTTAQANLPPHVQAALDTIYGTHASGKSHTMAHQLTTYGALRGHDFNTLNAQEQGHLLGDLSFIATTAKGPSADKARKLIDRFTPAGTPSGHVPTGAVIPPANAVAGQVRYATPLKGLEKAKDSGKSGDGWISLPGGGRVWGAHGAAGLMLMHQDPQTGEKRYLMVQRGPAISDPGKWTFPGGASDSKETPHQGAARETIEELGFKDDALKDALVHGDHTFSVPNSSWKYTTVAAQVPTMIQPDLSTAHARAETSDAKWMTEAEIKALDASGKLHHPIAGGKLEKNVLSLYPQTSGIKLGQVARPGPVSTRQGRLPVPPGGRQAPGASFNAWTHPHKQSKGKDLIGDKTALDAQRQKIKTDRKLYDGKTADGRLAAIGAQQGFDDTPTVVDKNEMDRLLATGNYIEAFRGVYGAGGGYSARSRGGSGGKTAAEINEEMRSGPAYYGKGIFGNGYYLATQRSVARQYSDSSSGSVVRVLIPKTAVMQKYDKVAKESHASGPRSSQAKGAGYGETSTFYDPGRYAAAKGIDGIEIEQHHVSPGGGARHVASHGKPAFNWLNRSVLIVQKEPG